MKKLLFLLMFCLGIHANSLATTPAEILKKIETASAMQYCEISVEKVLTLNQDIFVLYRNEGFPIKDEGMTKCSMGTGTNGIHLAKMNQDLKVSNLDLFSQLNVGYISTDGVTLSSNGILTFKSYEYGEEDPSCCPSNLYMNQVQLPSMKLLKRQFIKRDNY